jgi:uncharacterized protein YlxW (UPF0749 family)
VPVAVVSNVNSAAGIIAIAAGAVALVALVCALVLFASLRRLRQAQRVVLGERREDLVEHAASLQASFQALAEYVEASVQGLTERVAHAERRLDGTIGNRALVRYDAYGEMSGMQSLSIALLDATGSGVVLSSIHHRDTARLYAKQIRDGRPELELSPEENEAVALAMSGREQQPASGG